MAAASSPPKCSEGIEVVTEIISTGLININAFDKQGLTPLHVAVGNEKYLLTKSLLQNGANVNLKTVHGHTALGIAIKAHLPDMVKILLDHHAGLNHVCSLYKSALWLAIKNQPVEQRDQIQHTSILDLIFQYGMKSEKALEAYYYKLCKAVVNDDFRTAKRVINFLEDINFEDIGTGSPLDYAVHLNRSKIAELMLKKGVSELSCQSAFFIAIQEERLEMVELFLKFKINVNFSGLYFPGSYRVTPLYQAVENNSYKLIQLLLDNGAEVGGLSIYDDNCSETALHAASRLGSFEAVKLLLESGAQADSRNSDGQTPLHLICPDMKDLELLHLLLLYGAQIPMRDKYHWSILHYVGNNLDLSIVEFVIGLALKAGVDINARSKNGCTAIDCVTCDNFVEFLKNGADLNIQSDDGEYPQHDCNDGEDLECPAYEYVGRLQYLGYKVEHPQFQNYQILEESLELYRQELERLNKQIIAWNPKTTLRDVLFMSRSDLVRYSRNKNLSEALVQCGNDFKSKYVYFGSVLNVQCRRGRYRNKFKTFAKSSLQKILGQRVPDICSNVIFKYLADEQLAEFNHENFD